MLASIISTLLGASLLALGRKLFWLFVGAVGFAVGLRLTERLWPGSELWGLLAGLVVGILFALLAVLVQSIAIGAAGFLAGGYVLIGIAAMLGIERGPLFWGAFLLGGVLGTLLVSYLFEWAIITLSSLVGASMIVNALDAGRGFGGVLLIVLFILGVAVQGSALRRERAPAEHG